VREVAPLAESGTRSRRIRITLANPDPAFRLGATVNVVLTRTIPSRILLPASALLGAGNRRSVWVVSADGTSVTRRDVTVAPDRTEAEAGRIAIIEGLRAGDRVVIAGVHALTEGQAVRLTDGAV
jgi:membrane fusion protein, multidrug efflux system